MYEQELVIPTRKLIKEGTLKKSSGLSKKLRLFLFNDILVYCALTKIPYAYKGHTTVKSFSVTEVESTFIL